jgi:serine/threonine protein kinase
MGTDIFIDPNVYLENIYDKDYINNTSETDIYSLALTMYCMLTNNVYFNEDEIEELEDIVRTNKKQLDNVTKGFLEEKIYSLYISCYDRAIINLEKYLDFLDDRLSEIPDDEVYTNIYKMISFIIYNLKPFRKTRDTPETALLKLKEE